MVCTTAGSTPPCAPRHAAFCDDLVGRAGGHEQRRPLRKAGTVAGLLQARHLGQRGQRLFAPVRQRAQLAGLDLLRHRRWAAGHGVDLAAQQRQQRRAGAGVGDVRHADARAALSISIGTCMVP
jgi:hypothetical protein